VSSRPRQPWCFLSLWKIADIHGSPGQIAVIGKPNHVRPRRFADCLAYSSPVFLVLVDLF
jgi:hypothetical protein